MQSPLFSVLITNFNNGSYLQEAIESVLTQSYKNWEIILVDDCSTDNSSDIYEKFKSDSRIHFFYNPQNMGCGYSKYRCIELAKGEICGFLDSDDALMPNAIETMINQHLLNDRYSLIYSTCYRYYGTTKENLEIWDYIGAIPAEKDYLINRGVLVSHFVSFKKSHYDKTCGIDKSLKAAVDRDLYCKLEEIGGLLYINMPLYYYRVNNVNSVSIGTKEKDRYAHLCHSYSDLNTICRRMGGTLYKRNQQEYLNYMRIILKEYYHSNLYTLYSFARFAFYYLKGYRFSPYAFSHILKIIRGI